MQAVVVHPGTIDEALRSLAAATAVDDAARVILPSKTLQPRERLDIYHGMYLLRMEEALASDYPATKRFLGDDAFFDLVRDYVQVYPSRAHTLNRLSDALPEFLRNSEKRPHLPFLIDLARLELAAAQVFDALEITPLQEKAIARIAAEDWERAVFEGIDALRLVSVDWNVNDYALAARDERARPPRPRRKKGFVAVYRRHYAVYHLALLPAAFELLSDLLGGVALGQAVEKAMAGTRPRGKRPTESQLFRWFREWISEGLFHSVRILPKR